MNNTCFQPLFITCDSAHQLYFETLSAVRDGEETESVKNSKSIGSFWGKHERPTRELRYATLILENPLHRLPASPLFDLEKVIPRAVLATLSDEASVDALSFYDPKAIEFSDDGKTLPTNYGYRARHLNQINQIEQVIRQLKEDPSSRRSLIHIHSPGDADCKYNPCIDSLHFLIRNGALECRSTWRSENALTLLPINLFEFSLLQELIASELGIPPGPYVHTVTSLHVYLDDLERAQSVLQSMSMSEKPSPMTPMPERSLKEVSLIRELEIKWRTTGIKPEKEWNALPEYWKSIAETIGHAIKKRRQASLLR